MLLLHLFQGLLGFIYVVANALCRNMAFCAAGQRACVLGWNTHSIVPWPFIREPITNSRNDRLSKPLGSHTNTHKHILSITLVAPFGVTRNHAADEK